MHAVPVSFAQVQACCERLGSGSLYIPVCVVKMNVVSMLLNPCLELHQLQQATTFNSACLAGPNDVYR